MNTMRLIVMLFIFINEKIQICNSVNTYPVSDHCQLGMPDCQKWCDAQTGDMPLPGLPVVIQRPDKCRYTGSWHDGCTASRKCRCECTSKSSVSASSSTKYTVPFEIKHKESGKCLDWWVESKHAEVALYPCHNGPDQKWIYFAENGAVISAFYRDGKDRNCLDVPWGINENNKRLGVWKDDTRTCVDWELSQWKFKSDGHIQTKISSRVIDVNGGGSEIAGIYDFGSNNPNQIFTFPAGALRAVRAYECVVSKLDQIAEPEEDEFAQTAWAIGSTAASMLPNIGAPLSLLTSFWNPTESNGPSPTKLVNDVRKEMNTAISDLEKCIGAKVDKLALAIAEDKALRTIKEVTTGLQAIAGAGDTVETNRIEGLFSFLNRKIPGLFDTKPNYEYYVDLLPTYSTLASLWNVISRQQLLVHSHNRDCWNFNNDFIITYARLYKMHDWIKEKAISTIMEESIQIISDGNDYEEWKANELGILNAQYLNHVENYIEALEDISPNLVLDDYKTQCTPAPPNDHITHNFPPSTDIITVYKYVYLPVSPITKSSHFTLSANKSSAIITSRGYTKDNGATYKLYNTEKHAETLPLYKKYNAQINKYLITTNKNDGVSIGDFILVSVLGYCSTLSNNPVSSCDTIILGGYFEIKSKLPGGKCFDVWGGAAGDRDNLISIRDCHYHDNQLWSYDTSTKQIKSERDGNCIDVYGGNHIDDATIGVHGCHNGNNQKWDLTSNGEIKSAMGGCLEISSSDNTWVKYNTNCDGGNNQLFELSAV